MVIIVMGVTGCGKTTVGRRLAERLGAEFVEGDALHPEANVRKMSTGIPLDDADRRPWLEALRRRIEACVAGGHSVVVACSALKASYRRTLAGEPDRDHPSVRFVYLRATPELILARLAARRDHFMPSALIASQFAALEEPSEEEHALTIDAANDPAEVVERVLREFAPS